MPRRVCAYKRPCNRRLRAYAPDFTRAVMLRGPLPAEVDSGQAILQHAEAILFHVKGGRYQSAAGAVSCLVAHARKLDETLSKEVLP